MNKKEMEHFEQRLVEEKTKLLRDMEQHESSSSRTQRDASGDLSAYSFHMADLGTDAMEREKSFHFASRDTRLLYHIDRALERIRSGTYGLCEECEQPIATERLEVVPHARLCSACKEKEEQSGQ
ncbi:MAG: TraR/DksA family transcriptional regulator [Candidatus Latescibacterota bacterium]|nr:MAG: TraR/DksA family transcriptional regulator [Candidatus Latescibacterota bacterium]